MPPRRKRSAVPPATPRRLRVGLWARGMGTRHCEWTPETKDSKTVSPPCNTITLARFLCTRNTLLPFRAPSPRPTVGRNLVHRQQSHTFAVIACTMAAPRPARHWRHPMTHTQRVERPRAHDALRRASAPIQDAQGPSVARGLVTGAPFPRVYQSQDQRCAGTAGATRAAQRLPPGAKQEQSQSGEQAPTSTIHPDIYARISHSAERP